MHVNGAAYRTIWPNERDCTQIQIIDQRQLPHKFVIEDLTAVDDFALAIRDMHVRGAGLIGATAGFAMYCAALSTPEKDAKQYFRKTADMLLSTRPTAKNLAWAIERQLAVLDSVKPEPNAAPSDIRRSYVEAAFDTACKIADEDADACRRIGEFGAKIIADISRKKRGAPVNILTHCNAGWLAFVDYGSATAPIYSAHHSGVKVHVWVDETRPWNQGAKLTAWELGQESVPHTLIADNTGGHLMQHDMVDLVIVGSDRTTRTGDVANKIGTYLKALAAKDCGVPFYVALPSSTFDWSLQDGISEIPIEERSGDELRYISGLGDNNVHHKILICPEHTPALNYGFDVTPARLVTGLITERGIVAASERAIMEQFPEHRK